MFQKGEFVKCGFNKDCQYCISKQKYNIPMACISLIQSKRRPEVEKQYHKYGYCQNAGFWIVEKHPDSGTRGCFESHKALNHYFHQQGCEKAIILEDDVKFIKKIPKYIDNLPKDAWILYLGWHSCYGNLLRGYKKINKHFLHGEFLTTHAYLSTTKLMTYLEKLEYPNDAIDQYFTKNIVKHSYGLYPIIALQTNWIPSTCNKIDQFSYINKEKFTLSMSHITHNTTLKEQKNPVIILFIIVILIIILVIILIVILIKIFKSYR